MTDAAKPSLVGVNHVALEVRDIEEALSFLEKIFDFELRGKGNGRAFIDIGDQFIALFEGREQTADAHRHFGLVVDDRSRIRELVEAAGAEMIEGPFLDFLDPSGNRIQVVEYRDLQFIKDEQVQQAIGLDLAKSEDAKAELSEKGIEPPG